MHFHCTGCNFYMSANKDGDGEANTSGGAQIATMLRATISPSINATPDHPEPNVLGNNATPDRGAAMAYAPYTNDTTYTASQDWQTPVPVDHTPDANDFQIDPASQADFDEWLRDYFGPDQQQAVWPGVFPDQYGSMPYMPAHQYHVGPVPAPNVLAPQPHAAQGLFDPSIWPVNSDTYRLQPAPQTTTSSTQVYAAQLPTRSLARAQPITDRAESSDSADEAEDSDETDHEDTLRLSSDDEDRDSEQSATDDDESDDVDISCSEADLNPHDDLDSLLPMAPVATASHSTVEPSASDTTAQTADSAPGNASDVNAKRDSCATETRKRKASLDTSNTFDKGVEIESNLRHPPQTKRRQRFQGQSEDALSQDVGDDD